MRRRLRLAAIGLRMDLEFAKGVLSDLVRFR